MTAPTSENKISRKKQLEGVVVSDSMDKTVVVTVRRFVRHPRYKKFISPSKRYKAHDENNEYHTGDTVVIKESRPLSKGKHFMVIEKIKSAQGIDEQPVNEQENSVMNEQA